MYFFLVAFYSRGFLNTRTILRSGQKKSSNCFLRKKTSVKKTLIWNFRISPCVLQSDPCPVQEPVYPKRCQVPCVSFFVDEYSVFPRPDWAVPHGLPSPSASVVSHSLCGSGIQHVILQTDPSATMHREPSDGSGMQHVHEDETLNREVCDVLLVLHHVEESPLGDVTFESLVSALPLDYCRAISVAHDGMWGHGSAGDSHETHGDTSAHTGGEQVDTVRDDTDTGPGNTEMDLQFSQQVRHRECTRTPAV